MRRLFESALWAPFAGNRKLVLVSLCENAGPDGRVSTGEEYVAERLRLTPRRVRAHLAALECDGWMQIIAPHAPGRATTRLLNVARILETADQARKAFETRRRRHHTVASDRNRTVAAAVQGPIPDASVRCPASTPDGSDRNTGRQRPKNQERNQELRTTAASTPASEQEPQTINGLVDQYRKLPGVERTSRDGARIAGLAREHGADAVRAALVKRGPAIGDARKDPLSLLAAILQRERSEQASTQASHTSTAAALKESLDRVDVGRSPQTEAEWKAVGDHLGVHDGSASGSRREPKTSAVEAAKRAGITHVGAALPGLPPDANGCTRPGHGPSCDTGPPQEGNPAAGAP